MHADEEQGEEYAVPLIEVREPLKVRTACVRAGSACSRTFGLDGVGALVYITSIRSCVYQGIRFVMRVSVPVWTHCSTTLRLS